MDGGTPKRFMRMASKHAKKAIEVVFNFHFSFLASLYGKVYRKVRLCLM